MTDYDVQLQQRVASLEVQLMDIVQRVAFLEEIKASSQPQPAAVSPDSSRRVSVGLPIGSQV
jgi:hypothetical protein